MNLDLQMCLIRISDEEKQTRMIKLPLYDYYNMLVSTADRFSLRFLNLSWISFGIVNILSSFVIPRKCLWKNRSNSTDGMPSSSKEYMVNWFVIGALILCSVNLKLFKRVFQILPLKISNLGLNSLMNSMLVVKRFCRYSSCFSSRIVGNAIPSER